MRLIDADALIAYCDKNWIPLNVDAVNDQPTIEPECKTGRWIDETFKPWGLVYHPYKCDQCGEHSEADSNFCPSCGARMEE